MKYIQGTVGSGLCYVVMSWCVKQRGPVFTSAFSPLIQIFVALFEVVFLHEQIRLGRLILFLVTVHYSNQFKINYCTLLCSSRVRMVFLRKC